MKIYRFYDGKMCSVHVEKETKKFYKIEGNMAFRFVSRIQKSHACVTPDEAVQEALNGRRTMKGALEDRLKAIQAEIEILESFVF